jgi:hypothetical protein
MDARAEAIVKRASFVIAVFGFAACASSRPQPASPEPPPSEQWVDIGASGPPTTPAALRVELAQRRSELLARCDEIVSALEEDRNGMGSVGNQVLTTVVSQAAAVAAGAAAVRPAGSTPQVPVPVGRGGGIEERVRLNARISDIRAGMHDLVTARTDRDVLDAIDRLAPKCARR